MPSLTAAHIGYEYQDLLVAVRLVDVLLGTVVATNVDQKLVEDDRFDDLTTTDVDGNRVRAQFKHTENEGRPLTLATFTNDGRSLRLDRLIACILADRDGPGRGAVSSVFRVVLRDQLPDDARLIRLLGQASPDPGPFAVRFATTRFRFDADALWAEVVSDSGTFRFVRTQLPEVTREQFGWACDRLLIELRAPAASLDLTSAGEAEEILLRRMRLEVGAEAFPNSGRRAEDVAEAFVSSARAARQGRLAITPEELLRRAQIQCDFGAVTRADPIDRTTEVIRTGTVDDLFDAAETASGSGGCLLVTGAPGQGKSWACQQLLERMAEHGWLVAEHYCFLGDADGERLERVLTEHLFGSLLARLADEDPSLVESQRPRYAADEDALVKCLRKAIDTEPSRRVALVVDGLDHITRVRAPMRGASDPSFSVAEALSTLELPEGCVLVVLSQPGAHLAPFDQGEPLRHSVPGLDDGELRQLAARNGVIATDEVASPSESSALLADDELISEYLEALVDRSQGNALYATYLCRETLRSDPVVADPVGAVRQFPPFDGTLENYYAHLEQGLEGDAGWVAEAIAVADFGISRRELHELRPESQHRVDGALDILAPVLVERASGIRIYHESFGRFLRRRLQSDPDALAALLRQVTGWLETKGLLLDTRAFRHLLPLLAEANEYERVLDAVGMSFVEESIAAAFTASAINHNLAVAIRAAAALGDWPKIARYVEMSRAASTYEYERYDSTLVGFADVLLTLVNSETVAARMIDERRLAVPARSGLQMCAAIDRAGGVAPWPEYMVGYVRESGKDNTSYGDVSNRTVSIAWARGRLRLASTRLAAAPNDAAISAGPDPGLDTVGPGHFELYAPMSWSGLAAWLTSDPLVVPEIAAAVLDTHGSAGLGALLDAVADSGTLCLAVAELIAGGQAPNGLGSVEEWCLMAGERGVMVGTAYRQLALGTDVDNIISISVDEARARLIELTQTVQQPRTQWDRETVEFWTDLCAIAARRDPASLGIADGLIIGEGWYRCWLRFVIALTRAEACVSDQSRLAVVALERLTDDLRPFVGDPRSIDLYALHEIIAGTIRRAVAVLQGDDWIAGFRTLKRVSDAISTTMSGELGGPVPIDFVIELAVDTARPEHAEFAKALIDGEIENGSSGRYYSDLASYRLSAARLSSRCGDLQEATKYWREACAFLAGYGWHKDITIYELLDPLGTLISADPKRGRLRVAQVQGLCDRVPLHTDGRETRGAWRRWWTLLATADPVALSDTVSRALLAECNEPNASLYDALEDLGRAAHESVDPVIAAAFRLSVDATDAPSVTASLTRLLEAPEAGDPKLRQLMAMLMARLDERPNSYSYSNSEELLTEEDARGAEANVVATAAGLPRSTALRDSPPPKPRGFNPDGGGAGHPNVEHEPAPLVFPAGAPGLSRAIRAWRSRPYESVDPGWNTERFAAVIGYRTVELAQAGRSDEAESALHTLADFMGFGDRSGLLVEIADGLERFELPRLSATAFALAWTRTRGGGGWLSFGGRTEIELLQRATRLDPDATLSVVADEVERFILSDRFGSNGICQAIVIALATQALSVDDPLTAAFSAWDEARAVIERRAPVVHPSDFPKYPYKNPTDDDGDEVIGDLEGAFALATAAGMAHPSRERKRRTLSAIDVLLTLRPEAAAGALAVALEQPCDPATHCWLMSLVASRKDRDKFVPAFADQLSALARSEYLTVRATARLLLGAAAPELPSASAAHPSLLRDEVPELWSPASEDDFTDPERERSETLVSDIAGTRIEVAESQLPGLEAAVVSRVEDVRATESFQDILKAQVRSFADTYRKRWPDAYLATEQSVEEVLQRVAAGGRAAYIVAGEPLTAPDEWESELGQALLDDPTVPLILERTRHPRPRIPALPRPGDAWWAGLRSDSQVVWTEYEEQFSATISVEPVGSACVLGCVEGGQFDGWRWLATYERRHFDHPDHRRREEFVTGVRHRDCEIRDTGDLVALELPPITTGHLKMWRADVGQLLQPNLAHSQPLIGLDTELDAVGDGRRGLGVPRAVLTPTASLLQILTLRPTGPIGFGDDVGPGLSLVTWRTDYDVSDYHLPIANATGCGVAIRPDLLDRLIEQLGPRLVMRDYVLADVAVAAGSEEEPVAAEWQL